MIATNTSFCDTKINKPAGLQSAGLLFQAQHTLNITTEFLNSPV